MTQTLPQLSRPVPTLSQDVEFACARIAPTWPLDQFLAVNPFWGYRDRDVRVVAAELAAQSSATLLMPRAWYRERFAAGQLRREHLAAAIAAAGARCSVDDLIAAMDQTAPTAEPLPLLSHVADRTRRRAEPQPWSELVVHQISQHAAAWFDRAQSAWSMPRQAGLYGAWRAALAVDRGLPVRAGHRGFARRVLALPGEPMACIEAAVAQLGLDPGQRRTWLTALLASVRGWAAWCAYERWQARLTAGDDDAIVHLLAIRAAWEWLLLEDLSLQADLPGLRQRLDRHAGDVARLVAAQVPDWLLQHAAELAYQQPLRAGLRAGGGRGPATAPAVQAVFCIDVRSERFRRALEAVGGDAVQTRGFAGFFGLPIAYTPVGVEVARPQLPGLLAPWRTVRQAVRDPAGGATTAAVASRRQTALAWWRQWRACQRAATSAFTLVETCGLLHGIDLLRHSLARATPPERAEDAGVTAAQRARLMPTWGEGADAPTLAERVTLAAGVLRTMGLTRDFARLVLVAGHGSTSANNPHAKGLDCGACGGQTGEVNARLLAQLLADPEVRRGLADAGIPIPATSWFVAGLHDTTTDDLQLFDVDLVPPSHQDDLARLQRWLTSAADRTRAERAPGLGLARLVPDPHALALALRRRAADWAQVRPEWGLADNAAFVVAPRARTRHLDLAGRVFLHDYEWRRDEGFATLTSILTAPMVVTNWINMQYYASTVDNRRFGSGNKVLHNVVGGTLGVFEGNGGDLRIGLSRQSLHDGRQWRHTPLRLAVFVEAPTAAIDGVIAAHDVVRQLVENGWLFLFQIDDAGDTWQRLPGGRWQAPAP